MNPVVAGSYIGVSLGEGSLARPDISLERGAHNRDLKIDSKVESGHGTFHARSCVLVNRVYVNEPAVPRPLLIANDPNGQRGSAGTRGAPSTRIK